ncbi:MAG: hypothetical protein IKM66_01610 [Clostridia bacterium]|nr:hypothetical protein [Clostridia bacterium]
MKKKNYSEKRNHIIFRALLCLFSPAICVGVIPEFFFLIGRIFSIDSPYYLIFILVFVAISLIITGIHYIIGAKNEYEHLHFFAKIQKSNSFHIDTDRKIWTNKEKATITSLGTLYIVAAPAAAILLYLKIKGIM